MSPDRAAVGPSARFTRVSSAPCDLATRAAPLRSPHHSRSLPPTRRQRRSSFLSLSPSGACYQAQGERGFLLPRRGLSAQLGVAAAAENRYGTTARLRNREESLGSADIKNMINLMAKTKGDNSDPSQQNVKSLQTDSISRAEPQSCLLRLFLAAGN
ncbi:uncharacterized protein LOC118645893 [Monomorium pharaonis]|uniref:uncharacterized protein LOC118645893 n=1 Tax=Monomorium pharaonis TaxID=307658 RepID=UPI0017475043|nr:uncharacterized protein LOC118645893 [Monomorium pharaonis]